MRYPAADACTSDARTADTGQQQQQQQQQQ
jgi:hypothetical protein